MARTDTLPHFLTDVADAIREKKGTSETIQASDFDTEIENLPSGTPTPTSFTQLTQAYVDLAQSFADYVLTLPSTYQAHTDEAITLHTPNTEYKYYAIQKRLGGKYRAVWFASDIIYFDNSIHKAQWSSAAVSQTGSSNVAEIASKFVLKAMEQNDNYYIGPEYDTLDECLQKFINNEISYGFIQNTYLGAVADEPYIIPYTNATVLANANNLTTIELSRKVSSNETIV